MPTPLLCELSFSPAVEGHGGQHRSLQIVEVLRQGGFDPHPLAEAVHGSRSLRLLQGVRHLVRHRPSLRNATRLLGAIGYHAERVRAALAGFSGPRVLLWERTREHLLGEIAQQAGLNVIALPQNLESMVHGQRDPLTGETPPASFETELRALRAASGIFTIAREEQWLLGLRGIDSDHLPYHPAEALRERLLAVRQARKNPDRFLVLGTVNNPPTEAGMRIQLEMLETIGRRAKIQIDVAGYGTERLQRRSETLRFHGAVSNAQLESLLIDARALLLHQRAAAGAVTRIAEMLTAGVPVVGNAIACRSAFGMEGVHCYDDEMALEALLTQSLPAPPPPAPPRAAEKRLLARIRELASR